MEERISPQKQIEDSKTIIKMVKEFMNLNVSEREIVLLKKPAKLFVKYKTE